MKDFWPWLKDAAKQFGEDEALGLAAALAFYSALSFAPLLLLFVSILGFLGADARATVVDQVESLIGPKVASTVQMVIENAQEDEGEGTLAAIFGALTLAFSASSVFAHLQKAMNRVWNVEPNPGAGVAGWLRVRLLGLGMVLTLFFLLLVSLVASAALRLVFGEGGGTAWLALEVVVSWLVFALVFAAIFKILPDVVMEWSDMLVGAGITAALFVLGKWAIGQYLGQTSVGSAYGAAGSLVILLVWVYYSSIILFFGAELTQSWVRHFGRSEMKPSGHAQWRDGRRRPVARDRTSPPAARA